MNQNNANHYRPYDGAGNHEALRHLEKIILDTLDFKEVVQKIVDSLLLELGYLHLGYGIVVLALLDKEAQMLRRVSISQTPDARKALETTPVPFKAIDIPLTAESNISIKVFKTGVPTATNKWEEMLVPPFTTVQAAEIQSVLGIKSSLIYPLSTKGETIGIMIFSMNKDESEVSDQERELISEFVDIAGIAVQNASLYRSLEESNEQLRQLDKMKNEFISIASHELRTPLTAIMGYGHMMLSDKDGKLTDKQDHRLSVITQSAERLISLVNDMLNISKLDSGVLALKQENFEVIPLIRSGYDELQVKADEKQIKLVLNIPENTPVIVHGDPDKVREVMTNLLGNALKFITTGSITTTITIEDNFVKISVADTGKGIAPEDMPRLFKKFGRLDNSFVASAEAGGTGLGLYICKKYIETMKGEITVQSELNKGSTFTFTLPKV
ncbi:MAG: ATP-binding protein [bacterium]|nr:ATP-binding protein [bacterium]